MRATRLSVLLLSAAALSACSFFKSVPGPSSRYLLDAEVIQFARHAPSVDLETLADQADRTHGSLKDVEVMVAVSGGGARAASFTLGVLRELQELGQWVNADRASDDTDLQFNALDEIDHFSVVSGGSWGVAAYLSDRHFSGSTDYRLTDAAAADIRKRFVNYNDRAGSQLNPFRNKCLNQHLDEIVTEGGQTLTMGDVLKERGHIPALPTLLVNTTILGNQSPFVFEKETLEYYRVDEITHCDKEGYKAVDLPRMAVSGPIAISGSVPGWFHSVARTSICSAPEQGSGQQDLTKSFFCDKALSRVWRNLVLVDGGIYDNYGYQTALEALDSLDADRRKVLIVIDASADTVVPFTQADRFSEGKLLRDAGKDAGFSARTTALNRTLRRHAKASGVTDIVVLDFPTASGKTRWVDELGQSYLKDLDALEEAAEKRTDCFKEDGTHVKSDGETALTYPDCRSNNFYRVGVANKTTYLYDASFGLPREQLGRLVVRLKANCLYKAIFEGDSAAYCD